MRNPEPATQTIKASEAREQFSQLLTKVFRRETRVIVEKSGIPVAAIISVDDLQLLNRLEAERQQRFKILDEIGEAFEDMPPDEIEREVRRAISDVREQGRRRNRRTA